MDPARGQLLVHRARVVTVAATAVPGGHGQRPGTANSDPPGTRARSRRENGVSAYAKIFAVPEQEVQKALTARVGPVFAEEALQAAGGAAWSSPALTGRERSIAVITALAAQGVAGDRLVAHLRLGLQNGLDQEALEALMALLAIYLGYAKASLAMETIHGYMSGARGAPQAILHEGRRFCSSQRTAGPQDVRAHRVERASTTNTAKETVMVKVSIIRPGEGEAITLGPAVLMRILEDGRTTQHRIGMAESTLAPHTAGPPQHRHAQHDEGFYVVSGTLRFTIGDQDHDAGPGTLVMVPTGAPHTFANPGDEPAVLLSVFTPDLYVQYFRDLRDVAAAGPPTSSAIGELMARYATEPSTEYAP